MTQMSPLSFGTSQQLTLKTSKIAQLVSNIFITSAIIAIVVMISILTNNTHLVAIKCCFSGHGVEGVIQILISYCPQFS